jgi:hypothetical protein
LLGNLFGIETLRIKSARLAYDIPLTKVSKLYREQGSLIFSPRRWSLRGALFPRYASDPLRDVLQDVFQDATLSDSKTRLIIPATDIGNGGVHVFKSNYDAGFVRDRNVKVVDAVLASCSAPSYFAPAHLNLIGDIFVVQKQKNGTSRSFVDAQGRRHRICCFDTIDELMVELRRAKVEKVFFDIDLDYFTESSDMCGGGSEVALVSDEAVRAALDPESELLRWVFERFAGMTIATEPEFCGGVINSNHLLSLLSESLFKPELLAHKTKWKHLRGQ